MTGSEGEGMTAERKDAGSTGSEGSPLSSSAGGLEPERPRRPGLGSRVASALRSRRRPILAVLGTILLAIVVLLVVRQVRRAVALAERFAL
jgi:hypothetical protein